jgi:hypothetical protein
MPAIFRWKGFRFFFFSNEGKEPPHVHVAKDSCEAKFWLKDCSLAYNDDFKHNDLKRLKKIIKEQRAFFLEKWYEHEERKY